MIIFDCVTDIRDSFLPSLFKKKILLDSFLPFATSTSKFVNQWRKGKDNPAAKQKEPSKNSRPASEDSESKLKSRFSSSDESIPRGKNPTKR